MPERHPTTLSNLTVGDYVEGQGGVVWKVTHERVQPEGRYLGITNADGGRKILGPDLSHAVVRLEYGTPLTEEQVAAELGAVLVTHDGPSWFHPPHSAFDENEHMLRGHLIRFHPEHDVQGNPDWRLGDLVVIHHSAHAGTSTHDHGE